MAIRYKALTELYHETQRSVTAPAQWQAFLASACRNYRLSFDEQLLVYAQRPDATAVLEIERWNKRFGRWVNRGANGIAVFDGEHTGRPRLKYYFDISDTHEGNFPQSIPLWAVRPEYEPEIIETLENSFGELEHKEDLGTALLSAAKNAVEDNIQDYLSELKTITEGSFLEELDEDNIRVRFRELMTNSIFYTLSRRCGQEPMDVLNDDDFIRIVDFNKLPVLSFLGNAVSEQCEAVLFDIGREMRKIYKKEITQQLEKSVDSLYNTNTDFNTLKRETKENTTKGGQENGVDVLPQGRLSVPESGREGRAADHREVRDAAQDLSEGKQEELVSEYADERQAESASGADRRAGGEPLSLIHI